MVPHDIMIGEMSTQNIGHFSLSLCKTLATHFALITVFSENASTLAVISNFHNHERETGLRYRSLGIHRLMAGEVAAGSRLCSSSYRS
jgi:hypothetical protein